MSKSMVAILWTAVVVLAIVAFIGGWVMGDLGMGFLAFLVRWILPLGLLIGFAVYRGKAKEQK